MRSFLLLFILLGLFLYACSQNDPTKPSKLSLTKDQFKKERDSLQAQWLNVDTLAKQAQQLSDERFRTTLSMEKQKQAEIAEDSYAIEHRKRSFNFQYQASFGIFMMVILIVLTGLVFSGWQFSLAMRQLRLKETLLKTPIVPAVAGPAAAEGKAGPAPIPAASIDVNAMKTELELSTTGIKVNSSVLGVIILVLSIAFFYLYLIYVYPIKYLSPATSTGKTDTIKVEKTQ